MTQLISIIGYPLKQTLSPALQQAALDFYHLDIRYEVWETEAINLAGTMNQLRQPQNLGANITAPYKEAVLCLLDEVDNFASLVGAVNTVINQDGKLLGSNTDAYGFLRALYQNARFEPENKHVVVLGAGGAARAVAFALLQEKINSIVIANRTIARAENLAHSLRKHAADKGINCEVIVSSYQEARFRAAIKECHLIVNCTTMGMRYSTQEEQSPLTADLIPKDALVYDLVYNPLETPLLRIAKEAGADIIGGLPMLVYQGAASFKLWTGREPPIDIMFSAAKQAILG